MLNNMQVCARLSKMLRPGAADWFPLSLEEVPVSLGAECQPAHSTSQQARHLHNDDIIP